MLSTSPIESRTPVQTMVRMTGLEAIHAGPRGRMAAAGATIESSEGRLCTHGTTTCLVLGA
jgi:hypothetical protein